jgi:alkylated DNA repair dioxygenase AlkB
MLIKQMQSIIEGEANVTLYDEWMDETTATDLLDELQQLPDWTVDTITLFGKKIICPRLTSWYGDIGIRYSYSGVTHVAKAWPQSLLKLRNKLDAQFDTHFNSVLCNYYRHGVDYMGWHSDDEKEIAADSCIASISLGVMRKFQFRHKLRKELISIDLKHGSLLLMGRQTQQYWQHRLPRNKHVVAQRINLTFRRIDTSDGV